MIVLKHWVLVQGDEDNNSWVGSPGRKKFIAEPVVNGIRIPALGSGPLGVNRHRIGTGLPIYLMVAKPWGKMPVVVMGWYRKDGDHLVPTHEAPLVLTEDQIFEIAPAIAGEVIAARDKLSSESVATF